MPRKHEDLAKNLQNPCRAEHGRGRRTLEVCKPASLVFTGGRKQGLTAEVTGTHPHSLTQMQ